MVDNTPIAPTIYKAIADSFPHAIATLSGRKEILFCNSIFQSLFGLSMMELHLKIEDVIPDRELDRLIDEVLEEGNSGEMEVFHEREDGEKRILKALINRMSLTMEGVKDIILITIEDISEKMRFEVEMIHSEKLKDMVQVARCLAHELGNSLSSIRSTLQFIKEEKVKEKGTDIAADINLMMDSVNKMTELLESLLDFNHFGRYQFNRQCIHGVINRTIALIGKEAGRRHIVVDIDFSEDVPSSWIDKRQMEYVFLNLLKNAIESIQEGGRIWIKTFLSPETSEEKEGAVIVEIGDTGIGIPEENLKYVFKPFFSTKKGGHGLGLYICQQIVERHNGKITVTSDKGRGSVFTITFPVQHLPPE